MNRSWTDKETKILQKYYPLIGDQISIAEICEVLNRSQNSIYAKAQSMGIKPVHVDRINYEILEQLERKVTL